MDCPNHFDSSAKRTSRMTQCCRPSKQAERGTEKKEKRNFTAEVADKEPAILMRIGALRNATLNDLIASIEGIGVLHVDALRKFLFNHPGIITTPLNSRHRRYNIYTLKKEKS